MCTHKHTEACSALSSFTIQQMQGLKTSILETPCLYMRGFHSGLWTDDRIQITALKKRLRGYQLPTRSTLHCTSFCGGIPESRNRKHESLHSSTQMPSGLSYRADTSVWHLLLMSVCIIFIHKLTASIATYQIRRYCSHRREVDLHILLTQLRIW